ncbi:hypothetical protein JCM8547_000942 [Rhodosporidiobolus lusitaniae]
MRRRLLNVDEDEDDEGVSVVFLPARAALIAVVFACLSSFLALALLVRLELQLDLSGGEKVLVGFLIAAFSVWAVSGLVLAYARHLPPPDSRLWDVVREVESYLMMLWLATFVLFIPLSSEVLFPTINCNSSDPSCTSALRNFAIQCFCVLLIALLLDLVLAVLFTFDLRNSRPTATLIILQSRIEERKQEARLRRQVEEYEALLSQQRQVGNAPPACGKQEDEKDWIARAYLAKARESALPFPSSSPLPSLSSSGFPPPPPSPQPSSLPPFSTPSFASYPSQPPPPASSARPPVPSTASLLPPPRPKDALGVPAMFALAKEQHHHDRRHDRRREATWDTVGDDEGEEDEEEKEERRKKREKRRKHRSRDGEEDDEGEEKEERRARRKKRNEEDGDEEEATTDEEEEEEEEEEKRRKKRREKRQAVEKRRTQEEEDDASTGTDTGDEKERKKEGEEEKDDPPSDDAFTDTDAPPPRHSRSPHIKQRRAKEEGKIDDGDESTGTETTSASLEKKRKKRRSHPRSHPHSHSYSHSSSPHHHQRPSSHAHRHKRKHRQHHRHRSSSDEDDDDDDAEERSKRERRKKKLDAGDAVGLQAGERLENSSAGMEGV